VKFLFTTFEGGGHVPPALLVARRLVEDGHEVLLVSDEANRSQASRQAVPFRTWTRAPNRAALGGRDDPLDDWRARWPPRVVRSVCDAVICGPAGLYASDTLDLIAELRPDAVVSNELLFGVMAACEATGTPLALLTANVWCFPTRLDTPPFGPGFPPATTAFQRNREATSRRLIAGWYDAGLPQLNAARAGLALKPLDHTLDQLNAATRVILGASARFDFGATPPPPPFVYAGPLGEAPTWAKAAVETDLLDPDRPNVLVSFSTTYQGQEQAIDRSIAALATLTVHGIVTLGPAIDPASVRRAPNVTVVASADHDVLVPRCAAMICHGGHGTVLRPLMSGVPIVCLPMGRDQPENAQRLASRGAGIRLSRRASANQIRRAVRAVIENPDYARNARILGDAIRADDDGGRSAAAILLALGRS
jgi:UDP:flavonoid glycosyltransferase YjiC (YdhE family)